MAAAFTNKLVTTVTDQYGNPVSGVTVTFTPPASGASGTFTTSSTAVTNASGVATSNTYTANTTAGGPYNVVASATGLTSVNYSETNTAKTTGDTLSLVSGNGQSATVAAAFSSPLVVKDADQYGNLVSGVTVTFTAPTSGASGTFTTSSTAVTGSNGQATSNTYTANTTAGGPYNVVASATGASSVSFPETNTAKTTGDTIAATSGSGQTTTVGFAFANPLVATVTDQYGNPVSGVTVTFTPPASGASGSFTTAATAVTGSNGQATSNTYTANTTAGGPYNVVASATGAFLGELLRDQQGRRDGVQRCLGDGDHLGHQQHVLPDHWQHLPDHGVRVLLGQRNADDTDAVAHRRWYGDLDHDEQLRWLQLAELRRQRLLRVGLVVQRPYHEQFGHRHSDLRQHPASQRGGRDRPQWEQHHHADRDREHHHCIEHQRHHDHRGYGECPGSR